VGVFLRRGFEPLTLSDAMRRSNGKSLAVTFDDAFRSIPELALPALADLGVPATVFVPTANMEEGSVRAWPEIEEWLGTPWERELTGAGWDEIGQLTDAGWEIGSHTRTHPHLVSLDDDSLRDELQRSREECTVGGGAPCRALAYPFGEADARVARTAGEVGYEVAATLADRIPPPTDGRPNPMLLPRLGVHQKDGPARLWLKSEVFLRGRRTWNAAQRLRSVLP
jgi:peptidoglycan/xylan/chitin deacetylase (PgdA/CDA1 family)